MERLHGRAFPERFFRRCQISQRAGHVIRRPGNDGGKESGDAGLKQGMNGAGDLGMSRGGSVVIHARKSVYLQIDPAGRDVGGFAAGLKQRVHSVNEIRERNLDLLSASRIDAITFHRVTGLCTSFPQAEGANPKRLQWKETVEKFGPKLEM